uniref:G-protein coupled receptors family 3 profile domain-containing protein n=1 Tax=Leptobrachium leishanense TaxID=445787 RepID=A0A8C5MG18_9ANUR
LGEPEDQGWEPMGFVPLTFQWVQSLLLAVEEITSSTSLLPNLTLGVQIYDSCASPGRALEGGSWMLSGMNQRQIPNYRCQLPSSPLAGVIGDSSSASSLALARMLGLYHYPQISYFSTSSVLSDRTQFPSFFRTVPSDTFQSQGLAQLVSYFGWTWVGLLAEDSDYGLDGIRATKTEILRSGSCVAFTEYILTSRSDRNAPHISKVIADSNVNAIVVFSSGSNLLPVMEELLRRNITGKTWVASESWSTSALVSKEKYWSILKGTVGFALHSGQISSFKEEFWEVNFSCKWEKQGVLLSNTTKICTGQELLRGTLSITILRVTYSVYIAVYALAWALQNILNQRRSLCSESLTIEPKQNTQGPREVYFDASGNLPALYDIVNWQMDAENNVQQVKVGNYNGGAKPGHKFMVNTSAIQWSSGDHQVPLSICSPSCPPGFRKAAVHGKPACCFHCVLCPNGDISNHTDSVDCLRCPWDQWPNDQQNQCLLKPIEFLSYEEPLGSTLLATSIASSTIPVAILALFIRHRTTPIVRANNYSLSCLLLVSLCLCFLCSLMFVGYPRPEKCLLRQVTFGMVFTLCVSCVLAKTITVVIAFNATKPGSSLRKWTGTKVSYYVIGLCVLVQLTVCVGWLCLQPPFPEHDVQTQAGVIIINCNEGSHAAFWVMLGYLGLLATISFSLAFLARRLPDNFNEAKFITFSMLAFLSVWVSYIPASLSSRGMYTVAMEIFAILSSSSGLVFCIFLPKCYIIIFKPELNTKTSLMGRVGK